MPCTEDTVVPTAGGVNVVRVLPSINTESVAEPVWFTRMNELKGIPPVWEARATRMGELILTSIPAYCAMGVFVSRYRNVFDVPVMKAGSELPELILRIRMSSEL